ncbi:MAG: polyprenyl synthetase family protein [Alphaproteobacteria bacterium]|jgi:farnesyl diphosphate synthase|nr:polyprenyl synthetase family protein [Alphaproteobacteria bacterium]
MSFKAAVQRARDAAEARIASALADVDLPVADAMLYAVRGGKGLRAFLVVESARLHGIEDAIAPAAAIECIHGYSLVHDDMPCMDDDALRRGRPTVHVRWDEVTAVLAGDALQSLGFELVAEAKGEPAHVLALGRSLARATGVRGMVGGQAMDIAAECAAQRLDLGQVEVLQAGKTGALIHWSAMAGALLVGADTDPLARYGDALGRAFQIQDDVLDVEGDAATVGKALGKDDGAGKATFVSLLGLDEAKRRAAALVTEACDALSVYGEDADDLRDLARYVIARDK